VAHSHRKLQARSGQSLTYSYGDTCLYSDSHTGSNRYGNTYCYGYRDSDSNADRYSDSHADCYSDSNPSAELHTVCQSVLSFRTSTGRDRFLYSND
jgi:hypothetical protein